MTDLDGAKDVLSVLESATTVLALVLGGIWGYFRFVRDRVYRPRLDVGVDAEVVALGSAYCLLCRISVKNIGTSKVRLLQNGTGVRVSSDTPDPADYEEPDWNSHGVFEIFVTHDWFESGETIRDEFAVALPSGPASLFQIEVRLVCKMPRRNITVYTRRAFPADPLPKSGTGA